MQIAAHQNILMNLNQTVTLNIEYMNNYYEAKAVPAFSVSNHSTPAFDIYFNNEYKGTINKHINHWPIHNHVDCELLKIIRNKLFSFFEADLVA